MAEYATDQSADPRSREPARNHSGALGVMALARFADSVAGAGADSRACEDPSDCAPSQLALLLHPCAAAQEQHQAYRHDQLIFDYSVP
jgi:hypothetical protein